MFLHVRLEPPPSILDPGRIIAWELNNFSWEIRSVITSSRHHHHNTTGTSSAAVALRIHLEPKHIFHWGRCEILHTLPTTTSAMRSTDLRGHGGAIGDTHGCCQIPACLSEGSSDLDFRTKDNFLWCMRTPPHLTVYLVCIPVVYELRILVRRMQTESLTA